MNKNKLIKFIAEKISEELAAITQAAKNTYDVATHEDNKPENKYDTRGLEASYLAGAQAKRVVEMTDVLAIFQNLPIKTFTNSTPIGLTALVEIESNDKTSHVLIMPKGGGQTVTFENQHVQVITPESPLGKSLMNRIANDLIEIETGKTKRDYEIISVA